MTTIDTCHWTLILAMRMRQLHTKQVEYREVV